MPRPPPVASSDSALYFPILIGALGIPVCLVTSFFAKMSPQAESAEPVLKRQLLISTILMTVVVHPSDPLRYGR